MTEGPTLWDDEPGQARHEDPPTAHAAALAVRPGSQRFALLTAHVLRPEGLTDEQACELAGLPLRSEYATRCSELTRAGLLEETDAARPGDSGLYRMVRKVTPAGVATWAEARARGSSN